jgi:hypothetical protein
VSDTAVANDVPPVAEDTIAVEPPKNHERTGVEKTPQTGKITGILGQGDDARNSLVYLTILWSFVAGAAITGLVILLVTIHNKGESHDIVQDIRNIWAIFVPLITLALGYAFGKGNATVSGARKKK